MADLGRGGGFGAYYSGGPNSITVDIPQIPVFVPERANAILRTLVQQSIRLALSEIAGRVSDEAGRFADTGNLAQSFGADPATSTGGLELLVAGAGGADVVGRVFSSLPYAIVMELGRRAGQPISRSGIDAIGLWAERKLGLSTAEAEGAKWAIAQNIVANGIEGKHYFETGVNQARPKVEAIFRILGEQLAKALLAPGKGQTGTA